MCACACIWSRTPGLLRALPLIWHLPYVFIIIEIDPSPNSYIWIPFLFPRSLFCFSSTFLHLLCVLTMTPHKSPLNANIFTHLFFHSTCILWHWVYITIEEIIINSRWIMFSKHLDISILIALIGVRRQQSP